MDSRVSSSLQIRGILLNDPKHLSLSVHYCLVLIPRTSLRLHWEPLGKHCLNYVQWNLQSSVAGMFACSFYEHLDCPNHPSLFQTKEDDNNEEAQSRMPGNQTGVAAFSHNKKSFKPLNGTFCPSQPESLAHVPVENIVLQLHTELMEILSWPNDAERNRQWDLTRSLQGTETPVKYAHCPQHIKEGPGRWGINLSLIRNDVLLLISKWRKSVFNQNYL